MLSGRNGGASAVAFGAFAGAAFVAFAGATVVEAGVLVELEAAPASLTSEYKPQNHAALGLKENLSTMSWHIWTHLWRLWVCGDKGVHRSDSLLRTKAMTTTGRPG